MISKNVLAGLVSTLVVSATLMAQAQTSSSSENQKKYKAELARISATYNYIMSDLSAAKDANEWDEQYHRLAAFIENPGKTNYSRAAMCAHLKTISRDELEYIGSIIESPMANASLKSCRADLLNKIKFTTKMRHASFDLASDIANIRPVPFEEREIDENRDRFSYEGLGPKEVMLTFDDGPRASTTPGILAALKQAGVKAAFFNLGGNALSNSAIVRQVLEQGHVLASHTFRHTLSMASSVRCGDMSYDQFLSELITGHIGVFNATGFIDPFFRFPNGDADSDMQRNVKELGLKDFRWNVDSHDWELGVRQVPDYNQRRQKILATFAADLLGKDKPAGLRDRGIALFHDIHQQTVDTLPLVLNYLADNGYKVVLLKPAHRVLSTKQIFPLATQGKEYLNRNNLRLTPLLPPTNANGDPIKDPHFHTKVNFFEMFPQLTRPQLVPVGRAACDAENAARRARLARQ
ncbi:MAG TPA: polysaccharide deacetylase family protein [Bdellovibrio sp.]|nr:polysaccharide deacetylase family protein [Bdellovibrio sp.]